MKSIQSYLNQLDFSSNLHEVSRLLSQGSGKVKVSCLGSRLIKVNGYKGTISLDALANKVLQASSERCEADDLTSEERVSGIQIIKRLKHFYTKSDAKIKHSNCVTKIINWIRELSLYEYTTRFYVQGHNEFRAFSEEKFLRRFGGALDRMGGHPASDGSFGPPFRICAKEHHLLGV